MRVTGIQNLRAAFEMLRTTAVRQPLRAATIVLLYLFGGIAESIGLLSLLPLLNALQTGGGSSAHGMPKIITDGFSLIGLSPTFGSAVTVMVAALAMKSLILAAADLYIARSTSLLMLGMRLEVLDAVGLADWDYFVKQPTGQIANVIGREIEGVSAGVIRAMRMLSIILQALALFAASLLVSWKFTILGGLAALLIGLTVNHFVSVARHAGIDRVRTMNNMVNALVDGFQGFKALKAMARENALIHLLSRDAVRLQRAYMRNEIAGIWLSRGPEALVVLVVGVFVYAVVTLGTISFSEAAVITALGFRVLNRINQLQLAVQKIVSNYEAFRLVNSTIARLVELREPPAGARQPRFDRAITFDKVCFSYGKGEVLSGFDLIIPANGLTVIIGASGAGKSTVVDLILALRRATAGRILIDDVSVDELDVRAWRSMIGYVPQEIRLFDRSLYENVALDEPSVSRADVASALEQAGARGFVDELPEGIDSSVGQAGLSLSGGERQRIALARALVHRPRLLLLDEASSALDQDTERQICRTLKDISRNMAILAISHQSHILEIADRAYRIEGGKITPVVLKPVLPQAAVIDSTH